ncbi:nicotinamide-nucleotide adenylyltransferase [Methanofollis formosanus]|uniref:Nicotinamide-nucleotide adenylyltransferase n=1 Tax=Methanofollis formosanus TaxID=299308 RepID=A0A8G1A3P8_9EURY|nr:nicotinamide-nucleotide adenylyltransferase [Methanofollis formosanus]QYZ79886.1 nicotinamide-nucleotide adenylyltransferase [Methanofollis formosanus]
MTRGFYIGRFQPYHLGHHTVIEQISHEVDELVIGVGSAQFSHELENPFTAGERVMMISAAMEEIGIPFYAIPIEDLRRNALWVSHVYSMTPYFDVVYSNNPLVIRLFSEMGMKVRTMPMVMRKTLSGTEIRRRMVTGEDWRELVPGAVAGVIDQIQGVDRMKQIASSDVV